MYPALKGNKIERQ